MKILNEAVVSSEHRLSPKGGFEVLRKHMSLALGGVKDKGPWGGGHPFDIEQTTIAPGKRNYPLHAHAAQTEYYIIVSGRGFVTDGQGQTFPIEQGDHFMAHPGEGHQMQAADDVALVYYVIADHHRADITSYPKTGKRQIKPEYKVIRLEEVDYFEGEE